MKIHQIIGSVTLCRWHASYESCRLLAAIPMEHSMLTGKPPVETELVVIWDDLGAAVGHRVAVSDGAEAAMPFRPELKAVDAYCSAILDEIHLDAKAVSQLKLS